MSQFNNSFQIPAKNAFYSPSKTHLKAVFKLVSIHPKTENRQIIQNNLDFYEALALLICYPFARIKFDRMQKAGE